MLVEETYQANSRETPCEHTKIRFEDNWRDHHTENNEDSHRHKKEDGEASKNTEEIHEEKHGVGKA